MTDKHPLISYAMSGAKLDDVLSDMNFKKYRSKKVLKMCFDTVSWVIFGQSSDRAFNEDSKLKPIFNILMPDVCTDMLSTACEVYVRLVKLYDVRKLELEVVVEYKQGDNKLRDADGFKLQALKLLYASNDGDIDESFMLLDTIFKTSTKVKDAKLTSLAEVTRARYIKDYFNKDILAYKAVTGSLDIRKPASDTIGRDVMYVVRDVTGSMRTFAKRIDAVMAYILEKAINNRYDVVCLDVTDRVHREEIYNKDNLPKPGELKTMPGEMDLLPILTDVKLANKNVLIITDGTDELTLPSRVVTNKLHLVHFLPNKELEHKFSKYGKTFNAF